MEATDMMAIVARAAGGPEQLALERLPVPRAGAGQILVQVAYAPLNPLDVQARAGRIRWNHPGFPFVPGCGFAGRVVAIGAGADPALLGQRVTVSGCWGGDAQYAAVPATSVTPIPAAFSWTLGAVYAGTARTAWHLVHSAGRLGPGQSVVLHSAAGPVALLAAQVAKAGGAMTIGLAGGPRKLAFAAPYYDHVLDYTDAAWPERVRALTGGRGVDVVIDGNSGADAARNYEAVATLGQVIYMGAQAGPAPDVAIAALIGRGISVTGFVVNHHEGRDPLGGRALMEDKLARGEWVIPVPTVVDLPQTADLHRRFEARELVGRALIRVGGEI
jgi:NADPH:quinone reductase